MKRLYNIDSLKFLCAVLVIFLHVCTYEWCNEGIEFAIDYLRSMTIEAGKSWFDMLEENHIICTSDIYSLDPFIT